MLCIFLMSAKTNAMDSYFELFDLESGNVIEVYERESDAIDALVQVVVAHGIQAIETFALTYVQSGHPVLIGMQDDSMRRVEQETQRLVSGRRSS